MRQELAAHSAIVNLFLGDDDVPDMVIQVTLLDGHILTAADLNGVVAPPGPDGEIIPTKDGLASVPDPLLLVSPPIEPYVLLETLFIGTNSDLAMANPSSDLLL